MEKAKFVSGLLAGVLAVNPVTGLVTTAFAADSSEKANQPIIKVCYCNDPNGHYDPNCSWFQDIVRECVELFNAVPLDAAQPAVGEDNRVWSNAVIKAKQAVYYLHHMNEPTKAEALRKISSEKLQAATRLAQFDVTDTNHEHAESVKPSYGGFEGTPDSELTKDVETEEIPLKNYENLGGARIVLGDPAGEQNIVLSVADTKRIYGEKYAPSGITITVNGISAEDLKLFDLNQVFAKDPANPDAGLMTLTFRDEQGVVMSETNAAGTHMVSIVPERFVVSFDSQDFKIVSKTGIKDEVAKRRITVKAKDTQKESSNPPIADPALEFDVTEGELVPGDKLYSGEGNGLIREIGENPGNYQINEKFDNTNYEITFIPGVFQITGDVVASVLSIKPASRVYGAENPRKFYVDKCSDPRVEKMVRQGEVQFVCEAENNSDVGDYPIYADYEDPDDPEKMIHEVCGVLTVVPRDITLIVQDKKAVYGQEIPKISYRLTSRHGKALVEGDEIDSMLGIKNKDSIEQTSAAIPVGSYELGLIGEMPNYNITETAGKLTVTPRRITVNIDQQTSVYGDPLKELTYSITSNYDKAVLDGDTLEGGVVSEQQLHDAGSYQLKSTFSNPNYEIISRPNRYLITPRPLTVTINDSSVVYGQPLPTLTYSITGKLIGSDKLSGGLFCSAFNSDRPETGSYTISSTFKNENYKITANSGQLQITPRPVVVKIDNQESVYGEEIKNCSYTLSCEYGEPVFEDDKIEGQVGINQGGVKNAGSYKISSTLFNKNYNFIVEDGVYKITRRPITVTIDSHEGVYGDDVPEATYSLSCKLGNPLAYSDSFTGAVQYEKDREVKNVGTYKIVCNMDKMMGSNYDISIIDGTYTIKPAEITVQMKDVNKLYGTKTIIPELSYTGFKFSDLRNQIGIVPMANIAIKTELQGNGGYCEDGADKGGFYKDAFVYQGSSKGNYKFSNASSNLTVTRLSPAEGMYTISGNQKGKKDLIFNGNVTLSANEGYKLSWSDSLDATNTWSDELVLNEDGTHLKTLYIRRESDGAITRGIDLVITIEGATSGEAVLSEKDGNSNNTESTLKESGSTVHLTVKDWLVPVLILLGIGSAGAAGAWKLVNRRKKNEKSDDSSQEQPDKNK